jgi:hypothetical protein
VTQRLTATASAETGRPVVRPALLALFDFAGGAVRVWSGVEDLAWDGQIWTGVGTFGEVGPIEETTEVRATGARFQLSGVPSGLLNEVVGISVQGRRARLWLAFMEEDWGGFIDAPVLLFDGRMDMVEVTDGGQVATIALAAENRLRDLERPRLRRYTSQDQQSEYPGDLGFDFVPELQELEIRWGAPAS